MATERSSGRRVPVAARKNRARTAKGASPTRVRGGTAGAGDGARVVMRNGRPVIRHDGALVPRATYLDRIMWHKKSQWEERVRAFVNDGVTVFHLQTTRGKGDSFDCAFWTDEDDVIYASDSFAAIHTAKAGPRTLRLPRACTVRDALTGKLVGRALRAIKLILRSPDTRVLQLEAESN